jgi:glutaredoxin
MYLLLGKENCSRCEMVKTILTNKNIEFEYKLLNDLTNDLKFKYLNNARENGLIELPLIIKDNQVIDFKEVI